MWKQHYDVLIVGAGVAGSALAYALATLPAPRARPLRICVLERSLAEPDRIVGELLQPGGVSALAALGMRACLDGIDATPVRGYAVAKAGETVHIPYPGGAEGRSFHHGRFIMKLREMVLQEAEKGQIEVVEATVQELVECEFTGRVLGVKATRKAKADDAGAANGEPNGHANGHANGSANGHANGAAHPPSAAPEQESFLADLTIVADGCFSNFRTAVLPPDARKPATRSHFVGAVLQDAPLPIPKCGTVCLVKGSGPVLLYQIAEEAKETRILIDVKAPLPSDLKGFITSRVLPQLPPALHPSISAALDKDRLRRMPNSFLPPSPQGRQGAREGALLLGDAWNMRHPLTGGGMTVALNDALLLARELLALAARPGAAKIGGVESDSGVRGVQGPLADWEKVRHVAEEWAWKRRPLASTVNILSVALYDLFGAEDECLEVLRTGCFKYFELGGECINGPVSLLSAITPSPALLFNHFFSVAFYSIYCMFAHPRAVRAAGGKEVMRRPGIDEYPLLLIKAFRVFWTACVVFAPLMWVELKW